MVRFAILGAGNIARRFAASLAHEAGAELVAASCRTEQKAAAFLAEVPHAAGARAYGSHEDMLADPQVDAVYLALPHALHREWSLRALGAGKHVLCEKPAMLNAGEMSDVAQCARQTGRLFMEAMKPRFAPVLARLGGLLDEIGDLRHVEATLCNDMLAYVQDSGTYHMTPGPGAGVLLDCGTYCASWVEAFCPQGLEVTGCDVTRQNGIDVYVDARLQAQGVTARLECAFDRAKPRQATLVGEHGRIVVDELHRPTHATLLLDGSEPIELDVPMEVDDFFGEVHHFVGLVEEGACESPVMSLADSIECARVLDAVRAAFV